MMDALKQSLKGGAPAKRTASARRATSHRRPAKKSRGSAARQRDAG
jgi:hypothetical protein